MITWRRGFNFQMVSILTFKLHYLSLLLIVGSSCSNEINPQWKNESLSITLKGFSPTFQNSEIYGWKTFMKPRSSFSIFISDYEKSFIVIQCHSYVYNLTLSYSKILNQHLNVNGTNIGLLYDINPMYLINFNNVSVEMYFSIHAYPDHAPVPGGCNMEFNVQDSPFIKSLSMKNYVQLKIAKARNNLTSNCDYGSQNVILEFYYIFLLETNCSKNEYFDSIQNMISVKNILHYGTKITNKNGYAQLQKKLNVYPGISSIYVAIAKNGITNSSYVPIYTCNEMEDSSLNKYLIIISLFSIGTLLISPKTILNDKLLCIFGISLFILSISITMEICSSIECMTGIASFLCISFNLICLDMCVGKCTKILLLQMVGCGFITFGFFINYLPGGILNNRIPFIEFFFGYIISFILLLLIFGNHWHKTSSIFVGSFCLSLILDIVIGSHIRFLVINPFNALLENNSEITFLYPPFSWKDILTTAVWISLIAFGFKHNRSLTYPSNQQPNYNTFNA